jgi:hypothetical protein
VTLAAEGSLFFVGSAGGARAIVVAKTLLPRSISAAHVVAMAVAQRLLPPLGWLRTTLF